MMHRQEASNLTKISVEHPVDRNLDWRLFLWNKEKYYASYKPGSPSSHVGSERQPLSDLRLEISFLCGSLRHRFPRLPNDLPIPLKLNSHGSVRSTA